MDFGPLLPVVRSAHRFAEPCAGLHAQHGVIAFDVAAPRTRPPDRTRKRLAIVIARADTTGMETKPEHTRGFRLSKSREKLELAAILLRKGQYGEAVRYSYLSMFYAVRMLLLEEGVDSDDPVKIIELAERYFEPAGWSALDLGALLAMPEGPAHEGMDISREKAKMFYDKARDVLSRMEKPEQAARG